MQIQVIEAYRGSRTRERLIEPGIYEVGDPALFGLEDYLVNEQHKATYLPDEGKTPLPSEPPIVPPLLTEDDEPSVTVPSEEDEIDPNADPEDYHNWLRDRLEAELESFGIDLSTREGGGANGSLLKGDLLVIYENEVLGGNINGAPEA